jgi:GTP cyclohydrolase II
MISVAGPIAFRQQREQLIERVGTFEVATEAGLARAIAYATPLDKVHHPALLVGDPADMDDVPVHIQRQEVIHDAFASRQDRGGSRGSLDCQRGSGSDDGRPVCQHRAGARTAVARRRHRCADPARFRHQLDHLTGDSTPPLRRSSGFGIDVVETELLDA